MPSRKIIPPPTQIPATAFTNDPKSAMQVLTRQVDAITKHARTLVTRPDEVIPQGPTDVSAVAPVDGAVLIRFRADRSGPNIVAYKIYRTILYNGVGSIDPGQSTHIATVAAAPTGDRENDYIYYFDGFLSSGGFTASLVGDVRYWVRSIDDRKIPSAYVASTPLVLTQPVGYWNNFTLIAAISSKFGDLAVMTSDVSNSTTSYADVTGMSVPLFASALTEFEFVIPYTSAATTTGSRWSVNTTVSENFLSYVARWTLTSSSETVRYSSSYNDPGAANASSLTNGNIAIIKGFISPNLNTNLVARFASEVGSSAITAKKGARVRWRYLGVTV